MRRFFIPATLAAALTLGGLALQPVAEARGTTHGGGGGQAMQPMAQDVATVTVNEREVLQLAAVGDMSAQERAEIIRTRIRQAIEPRQGQSFQPITRDQLVIRQQNNLPVIRLRDRDLVTITHKDAQALGMASPQTAARRILNDMRVALADVRLGANQRLPEDFVTVRVGGGAGTTPKQQQMKDKHPMPGGGGGGTDEPYSDDW